MRMPEDPVETLAKSLRESIFEARVSEPDETDSARHQPRPRLTIRTTLELLRNAPVAAYLRQAVQGVTGRGKARASSKISRFDLGNRT
jgi:hypothetical protein